MLHRGRHRDVSPLRLYDTARGEVVPFAPGEVVTMYTCGITPYDATHIGHAAVYITYDVLQRRLRDRGHETRCVRNITDVDDSILQKAREIGVHYLDRRRPVVPGWDPVVTAEHDMGRVLLRLDLHVRAQPHAHEVSEHELSELGLRQQEEVVGAAAQDGEWRDHAGLGGQEQRLARLLRDVVGDHALKEVLCVRATHADV